MVEYKPQHEKISVNGRLVDVNTAKRMVDELEEAIETAEEHQKLPDNVKHNSFALFLLMAEEISSDTVLGLRLTVSGDVTDVPTEKFLSHVSEREIGDLYEFVGKAEADKLNSIHDETENLVQFSVHIPGEVEE